MKILSRAKQILKILLTEEEAIPVKSLAEKIGVSKRTTQRELEYISSYLKGYEIKYFSKTGVGIWLEGTKEEKKRFLSFLCQNESLDVPGKEERRKRLILEILKEKGLKKLFYYSSQFGVSEATASTDLEAIGEWLSGFGLDIKRKPGSGVYVEGTEENYRRAIREFIYSNLDTRLLRESYESTDEIPGEYGYAIKSGMDGILDENIMKKVMECINNIDDGRIVSLTENSYMGLVIHISIAINRIMKDEVIEESSKIENDIVKDLDYSLAQKIAGSLEEYFAITIPEIEITYIWLHIKGSKHEKVQYGTTQLAAGGQIRQLVNEMIDAFDKENAYLIKQDDEFLQGLLAHLQPTIIRLVHGMQIHNPMLEDIKKSYVELYQKCENVAMVLGKSLGKEVPPEETGFLTVHFGAAMVRLEGRKEKLRKVHTGVVCSSGIGISRLMSSKLKKVFQNKMVVSAYGKNDVTPYIIGKTDFFISSIPLEIDDVPVLYVNPLLNEKDMDEIRHLFYKYERLPQKHEEMGSFQEQLDQINKMAAQIKMLLKYMGFFKVNGNITFDELLVMAGEEISPYSDRREMIREALQRREEISSQVFAELGFALLHARTKGVIRPEFTICATHDRKPFKDPYFKGIQVVIIMLVPEDENVSINNEIMGYISSLLVEEADFVNMLYSGEKEEIRSMLSSYLKKFFNQYISKI
ncbi:MAG: transcription antiterminator [Lachnospiraceae bacterium]|nr:transcription antiterminator [Lachnospiraceae bacterium]